MAVEESAEDVANVTEMVVNPVNNVGDIRNESESNKDIAGQLDGKVNKSLSEKANSTCKLKFHTED